MQFSFNAKSSQGFASNFASASAHNMLKAI